MKSELHKLEKIMREYGADKEKYSIGEYAEGKVCIVWHYNREFIVFLGKLDDRYDCHRFDSIVDAGYNLYKRIEKDDEKRRIMKGILKESFK